MKTTIGLSLLGLVACGSSINIAGTYTGTGLGSVTDFDGGPVTDPTVPTRPLSLSTLTVRDTADSGIAMDDLCLMTAYGDDGKYKLGPIDGCVVAAPQQPECGLQVYVNEGSVTGDGKSLNISAVGTAFVYGCFAQGPCNCSNAMWEYSLSYTGTK